MKRLIKENSKFIIVMSIVIILGIIGITYALKVAAFNPIGLNATTGTINANITYDGNNTSTITNTDKMLPISDTLVDINTTDERVLKISFNITGVSTNPDNTIYDISLRDINMDKELKSLYVKWRLYKNNTLLSEGNFSPSFDVKENNRLVLTEIQQDLTTNTDKYVYLMWISEICTGDITTCDSTVNQNKYSNKTFNASIKIEASTKTKKELVRTKAVIGDVTGDGKVNIADVGKISRTLNDSETYPLNKLEMINADINADGKVDKVDELLLTKYVKNNNDYPSTLPNEPITDYVFYGDVNEDGKVNNRDAAKILSYMNGITILTNQQLKNADVNEDGKVDKVDYQLIYGQYMGFIEGKLPDYPIKDYILYGDVNEDGEITEEDSTLLSNYLNNNTTISNQALKNSDINGDGKVNIIDLGLLQMYIANPDNYKNPQDIPLPYIPIDKSYYTIQYGDVNEDGDLNAADTITLSNHINGSNIRMGQTLLNADVDGNGKIERKDLILLLGYVKGEITQVNLPDKPITEYTLYGDLNNDGILDSNDIDKLTKYLNRSTGLDNQARKNADVNGDGVINNTDLTLLQNKINSSASSSITATTEPITS